MVLDLGPSVVRENKIYCFVAQTLFSDTTHAQMHTSLDHAHPHSLSLLLSWCLQQFWQRAGVCWPCEG